MKIKTENDPILKILTKCVARVNYQRNCMAQEYAMSDKAELSKVANMMSGSRATRYRKAKKIIESEGK